MNRKCGESVTTDEKRTFTAVEGADKIKVPGYQTLGNDNHEAMLDCENCFNKIEDKRNCHSFSDLYHNSYIYYVQLLKQSTLSAVFFYLFQAEGPADSMGA